MLPSNDEEKRRTHRENQTVKKVFDQFWVKMQAVNWMCNGNKYMWWWCNE